ncbi:5725_t:CDS:2 [Diversispora eburnea]|uniref:5725_t:CDS:1 n=1 Tax=Diversispora eburnea TaxID=1213867 RepID=A0A9N9FJS7_9GLOM|nr:5725_t:CDS:2 [Diversispora eburnea]
MATFSTKDHRPFIIIPSPFEFDILEFLPRKRVGCKTSNAFMIYRKIYVKTLLKQQLHYKMTDASNWASKAWKEEPEHVKIQFQEYAKNLKEFCNINIAECTCPDELFQLNFIQSPLPIPFSPIIFENSPIIFDNNYDDNYENYDNNYDNYENYVNNVYGFNDENYLPKQ